MLKLQNIRKNYELGKGNIVEALKGIDIAFRKNEFVSVLGPSGCGKTTLLNVIGGLDRPTEGVLEIGGVSTAHYNDRDWDTYRNHSIGFVFQSYNLIPHMNVLSNVEIAPTISGIGKTERRARAVRALQKVGLGDQLYKKPNQLSGGQMQRVAIARALVNDPEILLADEPTGALDTETSVQIMELLKEVARDRLVIMVTHNPDLAKEYSTRIVSLKDGLVVGDTMPYDENPEERNGETPAARKEEGKKKASMSFFTALALSTRNLLTKKGRTLLTSFAGSIGIIGIALILSVSSGVSAFIDQMQEDALSAYPISINRYTSDTGALFQAMTESREKAENAEYEKDRIYPDDTMGSMFSALTSFKDHDLPGFKKYFEENFDKISDSVTAYRYVYDLTANIYATDVPGDEEGRVMQTNPTTIFNYMGSEIKTMMASITALSGSTLSGSTSLMGMSFYSEMLEGLPDKDGNRELISPIVKAQYELVGGKWPEKADELVMVVDEHNRISNTSLYALGIKDPDEIKALMSPLFDSSLEYENGIEEGFSYALSDFIGRTFRYINNVDYYEKTNQRYTVNGRSYPVWKDVRDDEYFNESAFVSQHGHPLTIVGIVKQSKDATYASINSPIGYTAALSSAIMEYNKNSEIARQQLTTMEYDVLTGALFKTPGEDDAQNIFAGMTDDQIKYVVGTISSMVQNMSGAELSMVLSAMKPEMYKEITGESKDGLRALIAGMTKERQKEIIGNIQAKFNEYAATDPLKMLDFFDSSVIPKIYTGVFRNTENTAAGNLSKFGYCDDTTLKGLRIYAVSFAAKEKINEFVEEFNKTVKDERKVEVTDVVGSLLTFVTTVLDAISYVLIAFVAISLVVSSIMIAIITYISVLERTKEIGILRSLGASKKNIRNVFNAETLIEGFAAGVLGVLVTLLLCAIINPILHRLTGFTNLNAMLPAGAAFILIAISMFLTLIAGLIPAHMASKKDPVIALRSE